MQGASSAAVLRSPCCCAGLLCGPGEQLDVADRSAEGAGGCGCFGCSGCGLCAYCACLPVCATVDLFVLLGRVLVALLMLALGPAVDVGLAALSVVLCFGALAAYEGAWAVLAADGAAQEEDSGGHGKGGDNDEDDGDGGGGSRHLTRISTGQVCMAMLCCKGLWFAEETIGAYEISAPFADWAQGMMRMQLDTMGRESRRIAMREQSLLKAREHARAMHES